LGTISRSSMVHGRRRERALSHPAIVLAASPAICDRSIVRVQHALSASPLWSGRYDPSATLRGVAVLKRGHVPDHRLTQPPRFTAGSAWCRADRGTVGAIMRLPPGVDQIGWPPI
jgi:hypothetical protein